MALPINLRSTPARGTQGLRQLDDPAPGQFEQCDPATHILEAPADTSPVEPIAYLARQAGACHAHILSHAQPYPLDDLPGKLAPCHKHGIMLAPIGLRVQQQMWDMIRALPGDTYVCQACLTAGRCKSSTQPDGGEGLAKRKGVVARRGLKEAWRKPTRGRFRFRRWGS